jgi:hypothetical protein
LVGHAARNGAASATSLSVVNSPSTVSSGITFLMTSASLMPIALACSGICLATRGVRKKPGQMTLARTPFLPPSLATNRHNPSKPRLAATAMLAPSARAGAGDLLADAAGGAS